MASSKYDKLFYIGSIPNVLAASNSALAVAMGSYEKAKASYISSIGEKPNSLEYPTFVPEVPNSLESAIAIALTEHPSIDELKNLIKVSEINSKIALFASLIDTLTYKINNTNAGAHN